MQKNIFIVIALLVAGCGKQEVKTVSLEDLKNQITIADSLYVHHIVEQHADSLSNLYAADAKLLAPSEGVLTGKSSIALWFSNAFEYGLRKMHFEITEIEQAGNYVIETGKSSVGMQYGSADTLVYEGYKYVHIWKQLENGKLQLVKEMWNNDVASEGSQNEK